MYTGESVGDVDMRYITDSPVMLGLVIRMAEVEGVSPALVLAVMEAESNGNPYAAGIDAQQRANLQFARPAGMSPEAETIMQKTRWGLLQIRGAVARSLGFDGWLPELVEPRLNLELGIKYIKQLSERFAERHGVAGVIAAYRTEAPRKIGSVYVNQPYVDRVSKTVSIYETLVADQRENALAALGAESTSGASDVSSMPNAQNVPVVDHTLETLSEQTKARLTEVAAEFGIKAAPSATKAKLIEQILIAQASTLDFTAETTEILEGQEGATFAAADESSQQASNR